LAGAGQLGRTVVAKGQALGLAHNELGNRVVHRHDESEHFPGTVTGSVLDSLMTPVGHRQRDHDKVGAGHVERLFRDHRQRVAQFGPGQQISGDLGRRAEPALLPGGLFVKLINRQAG
jgi:hypothetical protein